MDSSYRKYYLYNEEVKNSDSFNDEFLSKGKSLYEVFRVDSGVPIFLEKHMERFVNSATLMKLSLPYSIEKIKKQIHKLININQCHFGNIKIVFNFHETSANFYAYFLEHNYPNKSEYENGVDTIFFHGERDTPNAKVMNVSFRKSVDEKIKDAHVYEAILVDRNGNITEGSKSNIFIVKGNQIYTAPLEAVLPGITRDIIISIIKSKGYVLIEKNIKFGSIENMDGLFISGTSPKVLPIKKVGNLEFDSAKNAVIQDIAQGYNEAVARSKVLV